ncbi:hypothetical protein CC78DRAFT_290234 [Lojkania enalia]|uniref:Uncharacterized protein n=1 Tax=Lojkania enalia TaxID=147567 RepID=A0A9P4KBP1_9PLEO|nr:hypothetical protein CC78DRAFT_290234 [Didymosphaeria enalia]
MATVEAHGVHLMGSINLPTTSDVFEKVPALLPNRLRRMPDGETGNRAQFIGWQAANFAAVPEVLTRRGTSHEKFPDTMSLTRDQILATEQKLPELQTRYEEFALESYTLFQEKKAHGNIPPQMRFQVSLPGIVNVIAALIAPPFQTVIEPHYEAALLRSLQRIQDGIPHSELAIQIDCALEIAFLEGVAPLVPYFEPVLPGVISRLSRLANYVAEDVQLGFHLCYGDREHRHFIEPTDMGLMVEVANALHKSVKRPVQWIHMPVPKGRMDPAYFAPLKNLEWKIPELYLGVVHAHDEQGTRERIATAHQVVEEFGVATECGMGRTLPQEFGTIMDILRKVSKPVV